VALEDFLALPADEQRAAIKAAGRSDREGLTPEHLVALEAADRRADEIASQLPAPKVTDRRRRPQQAV
jgi:hypothetical protein